MKTVTVAWQLVAAVAVVLLNHMYVGLAYVGPGPTIPNAIIR